MCIRDSTGADHGRRGTGFTTTVIKFYDQKYEVLGKILKWDYYRMQKTMSLIEMKKMDSCGEKPKDKKSDGLLDICIVTTHSK